MEQTDICQRREEGTGWRKVKGLAKEHICISQTPTTVWRGPEGWGLGAQGLGRGGQRVRTIKIKGKKRTYCTSCTFPHLFSSSIRGRGTLLFKIKPSISSWEYLKGLPNSTFKISMGSFPIGYKYRSFYFNPKTNSKRQKIFTMIP